MYLKDTNYGNRADDSENYDRYFKESQVEESREFTDKLSVLEFMIIRLESSTRVKLGPK